MKLISIVNLRRGFEQDVYKVLLGAAADNSGGKLLAKRASTSVQYDAAAPFKLGAPRLLC